MSHCFPKKELGSSGFNFLHGENMLFSVISMLNLKRCCKYQPKNEPEHFAGKETDGEAVILGHQHQSC